MEGRWTIHKRGWGHLVSATDPTDVEPGSWPVVPCDDAAIHRAVGAAMDAIVESNDVILDGEEPKVDGWALMLATRAIEAGFRAAEETP
jgi:hypothetical protein